MISCTFLFLSFRICMLTFYYLNQFELKPYTLQNVGEIWRIILLIIPKLSLNIISLLYSFTFYSAHCRLRKLKLCIERNLKNKGNPRECFDIVYFQKIYKSIFDALVSIEKELSRIVSIVQYFLTVLSRFLYYKESFSKIKA